jgi:hypothetical protein
VLAWTFAIVDGEFRSRLFSYYTPLVGSLWSLKTLAMALGIYREDGSVELDPDAMRGLTVTALITDEEFYDREGRVRNRSKLSF